MSTAPMPRRRRRAATPSRTTVNSRHATSRRGPAAAPKWHRRRVRPLRGEAVARRARISSRYTIPLRDRNTYPPICSIHFISLPRRAARMPESESPPLLASLNSFVNYKSPGPGSGLEILVLTRTVGRGRINVPTNWKTMRCFSNRDVRNVRSS